MKVILVQPYYFNIWEALGLAYIGAYLKKEFRGKLEVNFFQGYFDNHKTIIDDAKDADIIAFSCTSPVFREALNIAGKIKNINPNVRMVFGGWHPTAVPYDCLKEEYVDQVVVGEGENAFLRIIEGDKSEIVHGTAFDINDIFPDRELIKNHRTIDLAENMIGKRVTSVQSSRVCPFNCTFCSERNVTGRFNRKTNPVRVRDPKHILEELKWLKNEYEVNYFKFTDATWNTSIEQVIAFCEEKLRQGFDMPWEANVHCSFVTKEMLEIMKKSNCNQFNAGVESGSQKILRNMKKGLLLPKIKETFKWGKELGMERRGYFLMGMPNETEEDLKLTEKLVEEIQPDEFGITVLCPYPGTDHYDPKTMKDIDWNVMDEYSNPIWQTEHFSNKELKIKQKYLMDKFSFLRNPIRNAEDGSTIVDLAEHNEKISTGNMVFRKTKD
jgi:radical SAM superfamily enzyme YgiQ (UPF0313 family)